MSALHAGDRPHPFGGMASPKRVRADRSGVGDPQLHHRSAGHRRSAVAFDHGFRPWGKLDFYKLIPTLRHIVIAYQDQMRVEHYRRVPGGWETDVPTKGDDKLVLEAVGFQMAVAQVYFDIAIA
jgi:hypothetical protein